MNKDDYTILITAILGFAFPPLWLITAFVIGKLVVIEWKRRY